VAPRRYLGEKVYRLTLFATTSDCLSSFLLYTAQAHQPRRPIELLILIINTHYRHLVAGTLSCQVMKFGLSYFVFAALMIPHQYSDWTDVVIC